MAGKSRERVEIGGITLTSPGRVMYPDDGISKLEVAQLVLDLADQVLPHVAGRALSVLRCPDGLGGEAFFQKHPTRTTPKTIGRVEVPEAHKLASYLEVHDVVGLLTLVQFSTLELHPWGSLAADPLHPDRVVFDLDPDTSLPLSAVIDAAREVRALLAELGLSAWVKTTGGKGLHVVVPLAPRHSWDEVQGFALAVAGVLVRRAPQRYLARMAKAERTGKIFLDVFRNNRGATTVAAYSLRARPGATISTPLAWDDLSPTLSPRDLHLRSIRAHLAARPRDPWADFASSAQLLTPAMSAALAD